MPQTRAASPLRAVGKALERAYTLAAARAKTPERFTTNNDPKILAIPVAAWINKRLCRTKNNVVAEYALRSDGAPIGVAEWKTQITVSPPKESESTLTSSELLEAELGNG